MNGSIVSPRHQDTGPKDIKYIMSYHTNEWIHFDR